MQQKGSDGVRDDDFQPMGGGNRNTGSQIGLIGLRIVYQFDAPKTAISASHRNQGVKIDIHRISGSLAFAADGF